MHETTAEPSTDSAPLSRLLEPSSLADPANGLVIEGEEPVRIRLTSIETA